MIKIKNTNLKIFIILFPLLVLYFFIALHFQSNKFVEDEVRYLSNARNFLNGQFALPYPNTSIVNGPGYPIFLSPFVLFNIPIVYSRLINALLLYLAVYFISKSLLFYINYKKAITFSYAFGLYFPYFKSLPVMMTEMLAILLICIVQYLIISYYRGKKFRALYLIGAALVLSLLALTKIIYGYIILASILILIVVMLFKKNYRSNLLGFVKIFAIALFFCTPYLFYTYKLTDKFFYWGSPGNDTFYWMTSLDKDEYGDWLKYDLIDIKNWEEDLHDSLDHSRFLKNHSEVLEQVTYASPFKGDSVFFTHALSNIKQKPEKYFLNWTANVGRILFSYPYSYRKMKLATYYYLLPNMFLFVMFILLLYPGIRFFKIIPLEIRIILMVSFIYLGASSLVSAEARHLFPVIPAITMYFSYILTNIIKISFVVNRNVPQKD